MSGWRFNPDLRLARGSMAGADMLHVPFRAQAPALFDLPGGQLQILFAAADVLPMPQ